NLSNICIGMLKNLCRLSFYLFSVLSFSQNIEQNSYQHLKDLYFNYLNEKDSIKALHYLSAYLNKAKNENNIDQIAYARYYKTAFFSNNQERIKELDSIIVLT